MTPADEPPRKGRADDPSRDDEAEETGASSGAPEPERADTETPELRADPRPPLGAIGDLDDRDPQTDTLAFEPVGRRNPRKWGWLKAAVVLLVLGGGGYGAWAMWGQAMFMPRGDDIPVVRAADGPFKVRPEMPGGAEIPNRDKLVYQRLETEPPEEKTESLLPAPEQPAAPPAPAEPPESAPAEASASAPPTAETAEATDTMPPSGAEKAVNVPVIPTVPPKSGRESASAAPAAKSETAPPPAPATPTSPRPTPEQVEAAEKPAPPPMPPQEKPDELAKASGAGEGPYRIQLGAVREEAAARREWVRLRDAHKSVLGPLSLTVERADLGEKGVFYRIRAGGFPDKEAAEAACRTLQQQKVACLTVRPEG